MKGTHHGNAHHIVPISVYVKTIVALAVLMVLTILAAKFPYMTEGSAVSNFLLKTAAGSWVANAIALLIATLKALLVIAYFMGVKQGTALVKLWAMAGFIWFTLMFIILADYGTRKYEPVPTWNPDNGSALPRVIDRTVQPSQGEPDIVRPRP